MKKTKKIKTPVATVVSEPSTLSDAGSVWHDPFVHLLLILVTGFVAYFNSINVPFMFDDYDYLVKNPVIQSFDCFPDTSRSFGYAIAQDVKNNLVLRPVSYFTFALNYALHGTGIFGFHLVNLLLHIGCSLLVYALMVQLQATPALLGDPAPEADTGDGWQRYLALFAALLFVSHPLQTQAVTYVIQRFVPLATLFYLAALVLYLRFRSAETSGQRWLAYLLALAASVLAMESKEIAFTLPVIMVLTELIFFGGLLLPRMVRLLPFLLTMAIIPLKLISLPAPVTPDKNETVSSAINLVNFSGISSVDYLMTQFGVIVTYLRLLFLPLGQNLDYDYPLQRSFFTPEVLLPLALLLAIVAGGFYLLRQSGKQRFAGLAAFGIFWFFITLAVESSIVPIEDMIFEQRAYLPSIGFFMALLSGIALLSKRLTGQPMHRSTAMTVALALVVAGLSAATVSRNMVWQDNVVFWQDVTRKSPHKARGYKWLGNALILKSMAVPDEGGAQELPGNEVVLKPGSEAQMQAAIAAFREAIRLEPANAGTYRSLANALMLQKNYDQAREVIAKSIELGPNSGISHVMLGEIYEAQKNYLRARQEYLLANKLEPSSHLPHLNLAALAVREGNIPAAIQETEAALRIFPVASIRRKLTELTNR